MIKRRNVPFSFSAEDFDESADSFGGFDPFGRIQARRAATAAAAASEDEAAGAGDDAAAEEAKAPLDLDLTNHFLIAMPSMLDPIFGGTVVYLCEHNHNGALGVVINKPTDMTMDVLLDRINLKLEIKPDTPDAMPEVYRRPVMFGGPVQVERGFVLHSVPHSAPDSFSSTLQVTDGIALTTSKDVLEAVALGNGPAQVLVSLGCSGWSAGQLEDELGRNGWLTVKADPAIIFELPVEERFTAALALLGIDPVMLSGDAGRA
ncbi:MULTISPECIES: YqgE/AlgH family protein [unclassified Herbaspirillum]|uniref:YqgE/AlgH family protein n=1 Tax=unclassified Herbaspirillum TaxID=2624150 RepID=UPI00114F4012|nr:MULTISPECIES: YqgE/AlgH family protein [unclassified Herbaspirillum]MBB5392561.1 putative transcriptional regulator [Herbaspirillum sp. SJZ102]TQK06198.1 putative transcriptional regulator [Herbaspirillum sp. SJZ130]TQK12324.1 putative transcriptional regulator [Herbaspirillum sp. SJZ106]TWC68402.1 putative transcriptional regulator [Herbaspirillum sp. SJZ099]